MEASGFHVQPYHTTVPSFGVWGFALARLRPFDPPRTLTVPVRSLDAPTLAALFIFPPDMAAVPVEINRLDNQMLVRYYDEEWRRWI
jgi:spermidine synthase